MTYTAVTLMCLLEMTSGSRTQRWRHVKNMLQKLKTYRLPEARSTGRRDRSIAPWDLPSWGESRFTRSILGLARLAGSPTSGNSDSVAERSEVLLLMETILGHIKDHLGETDFASNARTYWSFKEAADEVQRSKRSVALRQWR